MRIIHPEIVILSKNPDFQVPSTSIIYSDLSPDESKLLLAINADAIMVSVANLLTTQKGERLNVPEYGVDLPDFLFEIMDESTKNDLLLRVFTEITAWEPRVSLDFASSSVEELPDDNTYKLNLVFIIRGLGDMLVKFSGILVRTKMLIDSQWDVQTK